MVHAIRKLLSDKKSGTATSTAPLVIMCHVILVLFWQLDSDSVTMHLLASNPRQDVETNDTRTWHSTETPEAHMILWSKLLHKCRAKHKILHGDEMNFASHFSWCGHVARLTKADPQRETSRIFMLKIWNGCGI